MGDVEASRQAQRVVLEEMPCVFTYHRIGYIIHHQWLENLKPDPYKADTIGFGHLKYYKIDTAKRDEYQPVADAWTVNVDFFAHLQRTLGS